MARIQTWWAGWCLAADTYDALGSPTLLVDAGGARTPWTYDALSRLTREWRSGTNAYDLTYTYDPA